MSIRALAVTQVARSSECARKMMRRSKSTVHHASSAIFNSQARLDEFFVGNAIFNRGWVAAPASVEQFDGRLRSEAFRA